MELEQLSLARARDLARLVNDGISPFVRLLECRRQVDGRETVLLEVEATVSQRPKISIERVERISVTFRPNDDWYPDIRALRMDFPRRSVLHLNLVPAEESASLCLFELPWNDIKLRLTANELLFRLQTWLSDSASGSLHRGDQPLEPPYFYGAPLSHLILSPRVGSSLQARSQPVLLDVSVHHPHITFIQNRDGRRCNAETPQSLLVAVQSRPHEHCVLFNTPKTFKDLNEQFAEVGINLAEAVQLALLKEESKGDAHFTRFGSLIVVAALLRQRSADSTPETHYVAFLCTPENKDAGVVGVARALGLRGGTANDGETVQVFQLAVRPELTPDQAALYSGHEPITAPFVAIGAGAIGSQILNIAVRGGMPNWAVIDNDILLPHNLVRHTLGGEWLGVPKAIAVSAEINNLFDEESVTPVVADFQNLGEAEVQVKDALSKAAAVLDLSASVSVARDLALNDSFEAKRASIFVSPSGRDLVFIGEDSGRRWRLDRLEAQYYRAVAEESSLSGHLLGAQTVGSCRHVTSKVPQELMGLHASQSVRLLRRWLKDGGPLLTVLSTNREDESCRQTRIELGEPIYVNPPGEWKIETDTKFLAALFEQRAAHLPNETGGVLLGQIDVQRRVMYVCHQIPAPPDSKHQPTMYIRGNEGLAAAYEEVQKRTMGQLVYLGEWHSHPDRVPCKPSVDDILAGGWLAEKTRENSLPGLMLIVGEEEQTCWVLCSQQTAESPSILQFNLRPKDNER
ncbi:MAG: Mov34/MPN/PAD-1 family protein [Fimbriimonadaceae bacterium]|nr:Mov34/MPN/PAD-1 family protein [Fimbriimonadaceae bacterium]